MNEKFYGRKSSRFSKRLLALGLMLAAMGISAFADSFKVHKVMELAISSGGEKKSIRAGIDDGIIIKLPEDLTFIEGIELSFKVPQAVASWGNSISWAFYDGITPEPNAENIEYSGAKGTNGTFGNSYSLNLKIPLKKNNSIKKDVYSQYIKSVPEIVDGKIFLRLQLNMKGIPNEAYDSQFLITGKPLFINKGKLYMDVKDPNGSQVKPFTLFVDGSAVDMGSGGLLLSPGMHNISLTSDYYRNEQRTVTIEQAKSHRISIDLKSVVPTIRIAAPDGAKIFLDENLVAPATPIEVQQGDHTVRFVIGNYETVRTVSALNGRSYLVSVKLDAFVTEE